jgi:hypothetical protein
MAPSAEELMTSFQFAITSRTPRICSRNRPSSRCTEPILVRAIAMSMSSGTANTPSAIDSIGTPSSR